MHFMGDTWVTCKHNVAVKRRLFHTYMFILKKQKQKWRQTWKHLDVAQKWPFKMCVFINSTEKNQAFEAEAW